jgi:autotransporter adhesin
MNKSYRSIWNEALGAWVAASELTKGRGKSGSSKALAGVLVTAFFAGTAMAGALDGGTVNGAGQLAYGPGASAGAVPGGSNVIVIGDGVDTSVATATDAIAIGTQLRNNAQSSILMGNNGVELDAGSARSVVFSPEATGGTAGTKWAQPVTGSADSFVFVSNRSTNRITSSPGAVAIGGSVLNATDGVAIGTNSSTTYADGVALGSGSKTAATLAGLTAAYNPSGTAVGTTPVGELSIGNAAGAKRRITNVAAGGADTDAVNVSQLKATDTNVTNLTTTVGNVSTTLNNAVNGGGIKYFHSNSTDVDSQAIGLDSVAIGPQAVAGKQNAFAAGMGAKAQGINSTAVGINSVAMGEGDLYIGNGAGTGGQASSRDNAGFGSFAGQRVNGGVNIAAGARTGNDVTGSANSAFGAEAGNSVVGEENIAIGYRAGQNIGATGALISRTVAIGSSAKASQNDAIAIGNGAQATGKQSISIGTGNVVSGAKSGAFGDPNTVTGTGSYAIGNDNTIAANNAFVVGNNVTIAAGLDGAVGIGNGSTVTASTVASYNPGTGTVAGTAIGSNVVSVGAAGVERRLCPWQQHHHHAQQLGRAG